MIQRSHHQARYRLLHDRLNLKEIITGARVYFDCANTHFQRIAIVCSLQPNNQA
jgi:hypothetical protein